MLLLSRCLTLAGAGNQGRGGVADVESNLLKISEQLLCVRK
jgi:hypothetical protein